jgi:hypothetical protein
MNALATTTAAPAIGTTTNRGIYLGLLKSKFGPELVHTFKNQYGGTSETLRLDNLQILSSEQWDVIVTNSMENMRRHFENLPSHVMD